MRILSSSASRFLDCRYIYPRKSAFLYTQIFFPPTPRGNWVLSDDESLIMMIRRSWLGGLLRFPYFSRPRWAAERCFLGTPWITLYYYRAFLGGLTFGWILELPFLAGGFCLELCLSDNGPPQSEVIWFCKFCTINRKCSVEKLSSRTIRWYAQCLRPQNASEFQSNLLIDNLRHTKHTRT
jgi:hypothetical protein